MKYIIGYKFKCGGNIEDSIIKEKINKRKYEDTNFKFGNEYSIYNIRINPIDKNVEYSFNGPQGLFKVIFEDISAAEAKIEKISNE